VRKTDVICSECGAGFRRLELWSEVGEKGEYHCPACGSTLEMIDGSKLVAYRLTVEPGVRAMRN
jgi:DNA-directed RNA polymerase subunit RPC12/RpoP